LVIDLDWEWGFIDDTHVKGYQHSTGAADQEMQIHSYFLNAVENSDPSEGSLV